MQVPAQKNILATNTAAFIDGSGSSGIIAESISMSAEDQSKIEADVAAASLGVAGSGSISGALSVGVSLAKNRLSNETESSILNADVTSRTGDIMLNADTPENDSLFAFDFTNSGTQALKTGDKVQVDGDTVYRFLGEQYQYTSDFGTVTVEQNEIVKVVDDFTGSGQAGAFYRANSQLNNIDLGNADYNDTGTWTLIEQNLANEVYTDKNRWKQDSSISALSIAASLSAGISGNAGLALSGAGAESTNVLLTKTNAFIQDSTVDSAGDVLLNAQSSASIDATVVAASAAIGAGGSVGVGASIGAAVARNLMGYDLDNNNDAFRDTTTTNVIQAYVQDSSITAADDLLQTSLSTQAIESFVLAGSAAVGAAGTVGLAASGAGVSAENRLATEVRSFIDGDGANGIAADYIVLTADDMSSITVDAVGASLAIGAGGTGGAALSVGVALAMNHISNVTEASISNADNVTTNGGQDFTTASGDQDISQGIRVQLESNYTGGGVAGAVYEFVGNGGSLNLGSQDYSDETQWRRVGEITLRASADSSIDALSVAASVAVAAGGVGGLALSGAGAEATNVILTKTNAFIFQSDVDTTSTSSAGDVVFDAQNSSAIDAIIAGASVSVAGGGAAGIGVAIGAAIARNLIGWDVDSNGDAFQDATTESTVWAYVEDSSINAQGDLIQTAIADQTIDAVVVAASLAVAGGGGFGAAGAGSGTNMQNLIAGNISAHIDGDGGNGISANHITLTADDTSTIIADAASAAVAFAFSGGGSISIAIAANIANNEIGNTINSSIRNASNTTARMGGSSDPGMTIHASENATIDAFTVAASVSTSISLAGVAFAGAGTNATNTINATVNASIEDSSNVVSADTIDIAATNMSDINAEIVDVAFAGGIVGACRGCHVKQKYFERNRECINQQFDRRSHVGRHLDHGRFDAGYRYPSRHGCCDGSNWSECCGGRDLM